jgi:Phosphatase
MPVTTATPPTRRELRDHLLATRLAGPVATPREKNLHSYRLFACRDPRQLLGLDPERGWTPGGVLELMARRCGVCPDPAHTSGQDHIDPEHTLAALDAFADRIAAAVGARAPVLLGTGHPDRLLGFYAALARALRAAGCRVIDPARGRRVDVVTAIGVRPHLLDYVQGVALIRPEAAHDGSPRPPAHTHSPLPLRAALSGCLDGGEPLPRLVVGDHGWVCAAGQTGIEAIGLADSNDPALFVGEAEGSVAVVVPLDDAMRSECYQPLARYVLSRARLSR